LPLPDVIDFQEGPGILAKDFRDAEVPLVRLAGLDEGDSVLSGCNFLDPEVLAEKWSRFAVQAGDTLLSTSPLGLESNAPRSLPSTQPSRLRTR
jgi:type I restriction enzyme, S subunit